MMPLPHTGQVTPEVTSGWPDNLPDKSVHTLTNQPWWVTPNRHLVPDQTSEDGQQGNGSLGSAAKRLGSTPVEIAPSRLRRLRPSRAKGSTISHAAIDGLLEGAHAIAADVAAVARAS